MKKLVLKILLLASFLISIIIINCGSNFSISFRFDSSVINHIKDVTEAIDNAEKEEEKKNTGYLLTSTEGKIDKPFQDRDNIYFTIGKNIYYVNKDTGKTNILTNIDIDFHLNAYPVIIDDMIFYSTSIGKSYFLNKNNGNLIKEIQLESSACTTMDNTYYYDNNNIYFLTVGNPDGSILYGINIENKDIILKYQVKDTNFAGTPIGDSERVYFINESGLLHALNKETQNIEWTTKIEGMYRQRIKPILHKDKIIIYSTKTFVKKENYITAIDKNNGEILWQENKFEGTNCLPAVDLVNGYAYIHEYEKGIIKVDMDNGDIDNFIKFEDVGRLDVLYSDNYLYITGKELIDDDLIQIYDAETGKGVKKYSHKEYKSSENPLKDEFREKVYVIAENKIFQFDLFDNITK